MKGDLRMKVFRKVVVRLVGRKVQGAEIELRKHLMSIEKAQQQATRLRLREK